MSAPTAPAAATANATAASTIRPAYTLKVAETKDEIEACYDIRIEVFSVEQGFPLDTEIDEYDPISVHFLLTTPIPSPPPESSSLLPLPSLSAVVDSITGNTGSASSSSTSPQPASPSASATPGATAEAGSDTDTTDKPIGTIRFVPTKGKLTRLAVDKEYRKYGFGKVLVQGMEDYILRKGNAGRLEKLVEQKDGGERVIRVKCHSQIPVKSFYARMGYVPEGDEFDEEGAPHQLMVHELELTQ
ncbi:hypothetical protein IAU59_005024 [Kwoniella sp. CBS 9459]